MTQEDHQLDVSHQQSNPVYNRIDDDDNNNNQLSDDLHKKIFSKNITMIKANSASIAAVGEEDIGGNVGDIDIQKSLNNNVVGNDEENGKIISINKNIKSNMGAAAYIIGSKENEKTDESSSTSPLVVLSSSLPSEILSTSEDQLLSSSSESLIKQSNQNQNQYQLIIDDTNLTVNENLSRTTLIKSDENKQNNEKDSVVEQTALFIVGTSCNTDTVNENNNSKMTVIKPQANNENIREILQMKIDNRNKNISDTSDVNNYGNNDDEQKLENNVESVNNEKNLNQLQSEKNDYSKSLNDTQHNSVSDENDVKNEIEKNKSVNEVSLNNIRAEVKRTKKSKLIRQDQDDPIARLNALKANISNALKEVKAVLIEHGEPIIPENPKQEQDNNSESSKDDGVVKFRFVKKIRRRSTFEDDKNDVTEIVINQIVNSQNKSSENDNESETQSTETEGKVVESSKTENKNDGSENCVKKGSKMPLVESVISEVQNVDDVLTEKNQEQTKETVNENVQVGDVVAKKNEDKQTSKVKKLIKQNSKDDTSSVANTGESQARTKENESKQSVLESSKNDKKPVKVKKLVKRNSKDETNSTTNTGESKASVEENEPKENASDSSKNDKKSVKVKKLVKRNSKDETNSATNTEESKAFVEDDKKHVKVKKLVKRNSKDESSSTVANAENSDLSKDDSKKNEKPPASENIEDKNKIVKKVIGARKSIKSTVATALDKVLATTNLKLPNERRASVATTKIVEEPSKPILEKRRSSTTQTTLQTNQSAQNLKTNSVLPIPKTIEYTAKSNDIKIFTDLSNENSNKIQNKSENINLVAMNANKENNLLQQKTSPENSTQNTTKLEKENVASTLMQENKKPSTEVTKTDTLEPVPKTLGSNENEGSKALSESKSNITVPDEKSTVQLATNNSSGSAKISEEPSKQIQNLKLLDESKNADSKIFTKDTIQVSDSKQPVDTSLEIKQKQFLEHSTQKAQENANNTVSETNSSQSKTSQTVRALSSEVIVDKNVEDNQSAFQHEDQATNSNSSVVRNEITAKLAELKRPPFRMPVINKSNVEASKIHPLMVLHITPPKNFSTTTFKTAPQKATATTSTKDQKDKDHNDKETETDGEEINDKVSKLSSKRRNSKKVVIRRVKRRLSVDAEDKPLDTEIEEKEIESNTQENDEQDNEENISKTKSCLKLRVYEPGETVMYAERIKNTFKWKKATVLEKITSISYKVNVNGEERPAHISCIKKYTNKKVHFGGKEYLEIDYARDEDDDDDEMERYNIWARV